MRIWSLHPKYLDAKGLVALWREALLAKHVLEGKTDGYKSHPQLDRFYHSHKPISAINFYLKEVHVEAVRRNYNFDPTKFSARFRPDQLSVTQGQLEYEFEHLLGKLHVRDRKKYSALKTETNIDTHPLFRMVRGSIAPWEIVKVT